MKYYTRTTYDIIYKYLFILGLSVLDRELERVNIILYSTLHDALNFCWNELGK